jgi:uncharacterized membrane protein YraQ (UPF0718 family)
MGLALGLVVATAMNGPVVDLRIDNEIIVLAFCQMCFILYYVFAVGAVHCARQCIQLTRRACKRLIW